MIVVKKAINGPTSSSFRHQLNGGIVVELKFSDTVCDCISSKSVLFMIYSPSVCSNVTRRMACGKFRLALLLYAG